VISQYLFGISPALSAILVQDIGLDSLDAVEIIMEIEKEFGITIEDDEMEKMETINDVLEYLRPLKEERRLKLNQIKSSENKH